MTNEVDKVEITAHVRRSIDLCINEKIKGHLLNIK